MGEGATLVCVVGLRAARECVVGGGGRGQRGVSPGPFHPPGSCDLTAWTDCPRWDPEGRAWGLTKTS